MTDNKTIFDLAIVGSGPAGLSASVYASRYGIKNIIIGAISGGAASQTHEIGNWLGTPSIAGWQFGKNALDHAKGLEAEIESTVVDEIKPASTREDDRSSTRGGKEGETFMIFCSNGKKIEARTVLLTMGTKHRHLGVPGEKELYGKGVTYCATCDGFFYKGKTVAVVGGNDSAAGAAAFLGNIAEKVYVIYRKEKLRCENFWMNAIEKNPKVHVLYNTNVKEIKGEGKVEEVILDNPYEGSESLKLDGLFVEIGAEPNIELVKDLEIDVDEHGYIKIEPDGKTSRKGIWAAGDITNGSNKFKQIVTAAAEGAIAANSIQMFLKK